MLNSKVRLKIDVIKLWKSQKTIKLKGQCHEIVAKMSPSSSRLGLNYVMFANPFFRLKINRFKATVHIE
jgi:hypothetical protein